ncbi:1,2-phenylacetyl-CoA epoxidase subunit PaaE [Amycolatopsis cihanbeyliensis]|uniref:Ring-1,2-phenylacetyl-CoA epoxidase subunit PaaE n=1 Tax=Amycolatopsis cihanbeyliensis TaxID=1128664 RepID=A0A542DNU1_AMYCI|nr:1,2-phenylacetyl-CoA epoxidase subunit PaaE [Amycolatopsis cihanbeyliensis]TQJ04635.1 ring-1,2-phenylacetyl-CoA epoxidase subunit PaaE [Amycolatopsis cihanbeyliensis]
MGVPVKTRRRTGFHSLTVAEVRRLCADAVAVTFEVPPELAAEFEFRPGQSLTLRRTADGREERRNYSICAPAGDRLRIGVREVPGGLFSGWLVHEVRPGDEIEVQPPAGSFTPDLDQPGHHVLVAAGSGITPVLSIAASLLRNPEVRVTLLYGNRRADTVMFADDLADLKDRWPSRLELVHVLSREPREAELFTGRLDPAKLRALLGALIPAERVKHWWLCGPHPMVTGAREVLAEAGVPRERVHTELFYVDDIPPDPVRREEVEPEGGGGEVTVVLDGRSTTVALPPDTTVLEGAQRVRPDLPFACKGGVCGTCRAMVVDGEVRMRRNFALEESEIAAGFVLTCQSLPVSEQVAVDYDA